MTDFPEPLTPADCDLRDFPFMPLLVARMRRSKAWLKAKRRPELGFYMVNLWTAAWHDVPAASLEDDDDVLADLAMCDPVKWIKIKADALHGWVKCSDNRLYHPVIAEQAIGSWAGRKSYRERLQRARAAKAQKSAQTYDRANTASIIEPVIETVDTSNIPSIALKGQGQGQGQGQGEDIEALRLDADAPHDKPVKAAKGMRLADDWNPGKEGADFARSLGLDPVREFAKFHDYWTAKPGEGGRKLDWQATWRNWCRSAADRGGTVPVVAPKPGSPPPTTHMAGALF